MTKTPKAPRPTWKLQDREIPATYPVSELNHRQAMADALAVKKGWERGRDITNFIQAAASFHIEAARGAYVELALLLRDGAVRSFDGWTAELRETSTSNIINALLRREGQPGAIHLSIKVEKTMTEEAVARYAELSKAIDIELKEQGIDPKSRFMKKLFGKGGPNTPSEDLQEALQKDPKSYREIMTGDHLDSVTLHAIELDGVMPGIDRWNTQSLESLEKDLTGGGYHPGRQLSAQPSTRFREEDGFIHPTTPDVVGCAEILLPVISGFFWANQLAPMISEKSFKIGRMPWTAYGDPVLDEAAHAAVFVQCGRFDETVLDAVKTFSRGLAEHDFNHLLTDFLELAEGMAAYDFTSPDNRFDANDGRDDAYVAREDGNLCLYNQTQNGEFRMELALNQTDGPDFVEFTEVETGTPRLYARFAKTEAGWVQDYDAALTGREPVPYHIENVKSFNYSIAGFASLHCVLSEEMGLKREEDDTPEI